MLLAENLSSRVLKVVFLENDVAVLFALLAPLNPDSRHLYPSGTHLASKTEPMHLHPCPLPTLPIQLHKAALDPPIALPAHAPIQFVIVPRAVGEVSQHVKVRSRKGRATGLAHETLLVPLSRQATIR